MTSPDDVRADPSIQRLLERMPTEVAESFTEPQLSYLRIALGARQWGKHKVDLRGTLGLGRWRYYFVFVAGRNVRHDVRQGQLGLLVNTFVISVLIFCAIGAALLLLYLIKSALGIDIFSDYSFGVWSWFKQLFG